MEHIKQFNQIESMTNSTGKPLTALTKWEMRRKVLKDIASEMDDTIEKLAEALAKGGGVTVNFSLHEKLLGHYEKPSDESGTEIDKAIIH